MAVKGFEKQNGAGMVVMDRIKFILHSITNLGMKNVERNTILKLSFCDFYLKL